MNFTLGKINSFCALLVNRPQTATSGANTSVADVRKLPNYTAMQRSSSLKNLPFTYTHFQNEKWSTVPSPTHAHSTPTLLLQAKSHA